MWNICFRTTDNLAILGWRMCVLSTCVLNTKQKSSRAHNDTQQLPVYWKGTKEMKISLQSSWNESSK